MAEIKNENREWYLFDAKDFTLGRLSTEIANIIRGKGKTIFRNNQDVGVYVVVINADKIALTGDKENQKVYHRHTGYLGHLKTTSLSEMRKTKPEFIIKHAVLGMLPKNKLRDDFVSRLKIYNNNKHPHQNVKFKNQE